VFEVEGENGSTLEETPVFLPHIFVKRRSDNMKKYPNIHPCLHKTSLYCWFYKSRDREIQMF
jgi:hypothetical protein